LILLAESSVPLYFLTPSGGFRSFSVNVRPSQLFPEPLSLAKAARIAAPTVARWASPPVAPVAGYNAAMLLSAKSAALRSKSFLRLAPILALNFASD
jgi:hypothetical protein